MFGTDKMRIKFPYPLNYAILIIVIWTVIIISFVVYDIKRINKEVFTNAYVYAEIGFNKDVIYRRWATMHGGLYVPVTENTPPNPNLSQVLDRDIITPAGKKLTLINPAYMTRQVFDLEKAEKGIRGHITSLRPVRPENGPDEWERSALEEFEIGVKEVVSIEMFEGKKHLRLMRPFITEKGCLKCHAIHNYKLNDVRGGVSISVPYDNMLELANISKRWHLLGSVLLWIFGTIVLGIGYLYLQKNEEKRIASEVALEKSNDKLSHANIQLQELDHLKSMFIASMSHELRTPLNSIIGFTGLILQGISGKIDEEGRQDLDIVYNSSQHLLSLINDVIDVSKIEAGKFDINFEEVKLDSVIEEVISTVSKDAEKKKLKIKTELPKGLTINSDRRRLLQCILNLVSNAVKYTEKGVVELKIKKTAGTLIVNVTDTGVGIKKEDIPKLFISFKRLASPLKEETPGTGLGLYLTKKIMKSVFHGDITVKSTYRAGSTFTLNFPLNIEGLK